MGLIQLSRPWTEQPQELVDAPANNGLVFALLATQSALSALGDATGVGGASTSALAYSETREFASYRGQGCVGVGQAALSNSGSGWTLPVAKLNALFAVTGQASVVAVLRSSAQDPTGDSAVLRLRGNGGNAEHYPYTDGKIYAQPFMTSRWITAVTPPSSIAAPHLFCVTAKSGSQEFYFNETLAATGSVAGTPELRATGGGFSAAFGMSGFVYALYFFNRIITAAERLSLLANPWQLFAPRTTRIWTPTASTGLPTLSSATYVPGSLTASGFRPRVTATY